ncbi:MAG: hypothetical protein K6G31_06495 [Paludibacteraceae bacterium]|nr:hypothetical protein [Paludibacteraceae bacterium]
MTNNTIHNFNLKDLFSPNNITGRYDGDGYCLKEGGYEFVFQAFDGGNARLPLSEPVRIHVYLSQAEPPRIIAPANGECVNYNAPVNFVWMEGAVTSYNPNRSYRLEIVELPEQTENFDAKSYINNNSTKITVEGIPGNLNFYTFQNTAGKLVKGRSYLWRVQLYDKTQMVSDARTVYSTSSAVANGGYSEVYSFKYTNCDPFGQRAEDQIDESKKPEIIRVDSSEALSTMVWKNDPENFPCGYIVCFNRADDTLSNWARVEVGPTDSTYTFKNVENGVQYLTHIIGIVDCQEDGTKTLSANSDNGSFTLPVPEEQECSTTIDGLTSQYSVENLKVNDYFTANDRNIKINKIERFIEGGDTTFSGEGQVLCPWFPTISLTTKFEKVKINRNYELVKGVVYVPTDSSNCGFFDLDEMMNDEYTGDGPAEEMSDKFKEYTSTDEIPEGELGVVNGELYAKVNGQAVDLGKVVPASDYENKIQKGNIDAKSGIVDFEAVSYWNPPYDGDRENYSGDIDKYYTNYSTSSGNYTVPWFAMASGSTSDVKARLQINDNFPLDKLKFVCLTSSQAVELNAKKDQDFGSYTYYKLPIFGGEGETSLNLYAVATGNDGNPITLGRAQILSMPKYEQSVVLIPVKREAISIDQASIEKKLNEIYSPLGITYKVTVADKFDSEELDFMKDGLEVEGSGYLSTETDAMKQLKNLYAQSHTIEKDAAYIFVCPKAKYDGAEVKGDMPRSGQTGYVFSTAEKYDDGWTVAHELGHGLYSFKHTFPHKKQGTTDNLMDYANGTNLKVWQWNLLYSHKDFTTPFLESDEDGMILNNSIAFTPDWVPFIFNKSNICSVNFDELEKQGCIYGIKYKNEVYKYDNKSKSYKAKDDILTINLCKNLNDEEKVSLLYYNPTSSCDIKHYKTTYKYAIEKKDEISQLFDNEILNSTNTNIELVDQLVVEGCSNWLNKSFFETDNTIESAYVDFARRNSKKVSNTLYTDNNLVEALLNQVKNNPNNENLIGEILKDKLTAYQQLNNKKFIVVGCNINVLCTNQYEWQMLAQTVYQESINENLLSEEDILITVPYTECNGIGHDLGIVYFMPGVANNKTKIDYSSLLNNYKNYQNTAYVKADNAVLSAVGSFIMDVFKYTQKKLVYIQHDICYNGEILYYETQNKNNVIGYANNYYYNLNIDQRYYELVEILQNTKYTNIAYNRAHYINVDQDGHEEFKIDKDEEEKYNEALRVLKGKMVQLENMPSDFKSVNHGLNEVYGVSKEQVCSDFTNWYLQNQSGHSKYFNWNSPSDECFYFGINRVQHETWLSLIDGVGIALSPIGLDIIADVTGGLYCAYKKDWTNMGIYVGCALVPYADTKFAKVHVSIEGNIEDAIKDLKNGKNFIQAEGKNTLKIASKKELSDNLIYKMYQNNLSKGYSEEKAMELVLDELRKINYDYFSLLKKDSWKNFTNQFGDEYIKKFSIGAGISAATAIGAYYFINGSLDKLPINDIIVDAINGGLSNMVSQTTIKSLSQGCMTSLNIEELPDFHASLEANNFNFENYISVGADCFCGLFFSAIPEIPQVKKWIDKINNTSISKIVKNIENSNWDNLTPTYVKNAVNKNIDILASSREIGRDLSWKNTLRDIVNDSEGANNIAELIKRDFDLIYLSEKELLDFNNIMKDLKSQPLMKANFLKLFTQNNLDCSLIKNVIKKLNQEKNYESLFTIINKLSLEENTISIFNHANNNYIKIRYIDFLKNKSKLIEEYGSSIESMFNEVKTYHKDGYILRLFNPDDINHTVGLLINTNTPYTYQIIQNSITNTLTSDDYEKYLIDEKNEIEK